LCGRNQLGEGVRRNVRQFHSIHPLADKHAPSAVLLEYPGHVHTRDAFLLEERSELHLIRCFVEEVQLGVEAYGPLIQQGHVVCALLGSEPVNQTCDRDRAEAVRAFVEVKTKETVLKDKLQIF